MDQENFKSIKVDGLFDVKNLPHIVRTGAPCLEGQLTPLASKYCHKKCYYFN